MHAWRGGATARFKGYSHALVVYPRITLQNLRFQAQRVPTVAFFKGQRNDKIDRFANPGRPLWATDRQGE